MNREPPQLPRPEADRATAFETRPKWMAVLFLGFAAAGILVSVLAIGSPEGDLPGVALGSDAVLHVICGGLLAALAGVLTILVVNGWSGRWPREFAIGGASVAYESAERDEKLGTAVDDVASDLKELADAVQSKVDSASFEDSQNAIVSELEEVRDLVNAVASWAGAQEEIRDEIREKLTDVGERVARLEGRLDQPHA